VSVTLSESGGLAHILPAHPTGVAFMGTAGRRTWIGPTGVTS
jgi:hypothetical protein